MGLTREEGRTMRTRVNGQSGKTSGFTLTEMILCVAIIGLLVSILLPGFNRTMEMSRSAVCKGNLHSLSQFVVASPTYDGTSPTYGTRSLVPPMFWPEALHDGNMGNYVYCPSQLVHIADAGPSLKDIYIRQDGGPEGHSVTPGVVTTNLSDVLLKNEVNDPQVFYTWGNRSNGSYENRGWDWVYDLNGGKKPERNQAMVTIATCAAFMITFNRGHVEFTPLGHHPNWGSGSKHWISKGKETGPASENWEDDVLVRLTGEDYPTINPPVRSDSAKAISDYAMNSLIPAQAYRPSQLLLVEYAGTVAWLDGQDENEPYKDEPFDGDLINGEVMARHLGRANYVRIDGSVADATKEELRVEYEQVSNLDVAENLWRR